jgi:hypothetical protein
MKGFIVLNNKSG